MTQATKEHNNHVCPFCDECSFDLAGLAQHITHQCDEAENARVEFREYLYAKR